VEYRTQHYIPTMDWFSMRMPVWRRVQYDAARHDPDKALGPYVHLYIKGSNGLRAYTEFHVDNLYAKTSDRISTCGVAHGYMSAYFGHPEDLGNVVIPNWRIDEHIEVPCDPTVYTAMSLQEFNLKKVIPCQHDSVCHCNKMLIHCGQDESIYKSNHLSLKAWSCNGEQPIRAKHDGLGVMVSAFVSEQDGFGLYIREDQREEYAKWRRERNPQCKDLASPAHAGVLFLDYGKEKDGYFDAAKLKVQLEDVLNFFEWKYADKVTGEMTRQILVEFDHSSGHAKRDDGAVVPSELRKATYTREDGEYPKDIRVTENGLGPHLFDVHGVLIPEKLKVGDMQRFTFDAAEGPYGDNNACLFRPGYADGEGPTFYEGYGKGLKQLVWERGLMSDDQIASATRAGLLQVFMACVDVSSQKSLLEKVVYDRGHVLILSPKYHPELAGVGVEYCWGQSKYRFRTCHNDLKTKNLKANVLKTFQVDELTPQVVLAYARKTRDYRMTYKTIMLEGVDVGSISKSNIEKIRKHHKCHRNILDQDIGFIRNVLKEEKIVHDVIEL
jgi:hypothetical protein